MADNGEDIDAECRIRDGDYVVLKRGDVFKAVQILKKRKIIFEKQWFFLDKAVGELYGTTFELESGGNLQPQKPKHVESSAEVREAGTDNRHIVDDGRSQKLTRDDIETLKEQGLKGQEIVQQLIDNSTTFRDKTEFAQQKYIKKKKKKYENNITVLKPSARILAFMYHGREPAKVCHLRYDTLAQMLTLGNVHAGSKIIVFETCAGLVLGSIMERMGGLSWEVILACNLENEVWEAQEQLANATDPYLQGYGSVIQMYPGGGPARAGMESFGFPSHFHETLHEFPLCRVNALLAGTLDLEERTDGNPGGQSGPAQENPSGPQGEDGSPSEVQKMETSTDAAEDKEKEEREKRQELRAQEKKVRMEERRRKLASASALLEGRNADGLVIASRFSPCPTLLTLLKFVAPSRPFVVYCQYREPLIECYTKLREQGGAINLRLTDSWLRHYQVLPNRTHPLLLMSGGGGYILSGTTVATDAPKSAGPQKAEEPAPKRIKLDEADGSCNSAT